MNREECFENIELLVRNWKNELENKVNNFPRKISQKQYVEETLRLGSIETSMHSIKQFTKVSGDEQ